MNGSATIRHGAVWGLLLCLAWAGAAHAEGGTPLFPAGEPEAVRIDTGTDQVQLDRVDGRWWVTGKDGDKHLADRRGVEELLGWMRNLETVRSVARFGTPREDAFMAPVTLSWGRNKALIGDESRIPGLVYVRAPDGKLHLMYPVRPTFTVSKLIDRRLFPDGLGKVEEIDLSAQDRVLHATRKFGAWRLTAPVPSAADGTKVDAWLAAVEKLKGDPVPYPPESESVYESVLTMAEGDPVSFAVRSDGTVRLGKVVFRVEGEADDLLPRHYDWVRKDPLRLNASDVSEIEVQNAEETIVFGRDRNGDWVKQSSGQIYRSWTNDLFGFLTPLATIGLREAHVEELGVPQVEVRFWNDGELVTSLELWMGEDGLWWARGGEADFVFEISEELPAHLSKLF